MKGANDDNSRLDVAFQLAVSRVPDEFERKILTELLAASRDQYRSDEPAARTLISTGLAPAPSDVPVAEHAAWTTVARAIMTLGETTTRN